MTSTPRSTSLRPAASVIQRPSVEKRGAGLALAGATGATRTARSASTTTPSAVLRTPIEKGGSWPFRRLPAVSRISPDEEADCDYRSCGGGPHLRRPTCCSQSGQGGDPAAPVRRRERSERRPPPGRLL